MNYRDMTFCKAYDRCASGATCSRALTQEVRDKAKDWWGSDGAPIVMVDGFGSCFVNIKEAG